MSVNQVHVEREQGLVTITVAGRIAVRFWARTEHDAMEIVAAFHRASPDPARAAWNVRAAWVRGRNAVLDLVREGDLEFSRVDMGWRGDMPEYPEPQP